jgi:DnaJ-class molecular chaperone
MMEKVKCTKCNGDGTVEKNNYDYPCFRCMGKGYLLMENGVLKKDLMSL